MGDSLKDSHEGNRNERQEIKINGHILLDMNHSVQKSNKKKGRTYFEKL